MKERTLKAGIIFFAVMAFFTLFSRAVMNLLTPSVTFGPPKFLIFDVKISPEPQIKILDDGTKALFAEVNEESAYELAPGLTCEISYASSGRTRRVSGSVSEVINDGGSAVGVYVLPDRDLQDNVKIVELSIILYSIASQTVVPVSALATEDSLYVIEIKEGFLGDELFVRLRSVETGVSESGMIEIVGGITPRDYVVDGWDRPLRDGQRVTLPYK
ncbi:MAG: hypothetical protein FWF03_07865 [Defluviitaleaceae bacterium]|nr:hypothetical protein [Defluviitaleaceae bacterium]